jgi:hypothetical protein
VAAPQKQEFTFQEWLAAFGSYMGQMFDKTRDQIDKRRWDNPWGFGNEVAHCNPKTASSGTVKCTG